jgi:hypothetical protein
VSVEIVPSPSSVTIPPPHRVAFVRLNAGRRLDIDGRERPRVEHVEARPLLDGERDALSIDAGPVSTNPLRPASLALAREVDGASGDAFVVRRPSGGES